MTNKHIKIALLGPPDSGKSLFLGALMVILSRTSRDYDDGHNRDTINLRLKYRSIINAALQLRLV